MDEFITLARPGQDEIVIQKSRFIGNAWPCSSEEEAQLHIREMREFFHDARHHCYAYIIGQNAGIIRYSDDGEPGGTAGLPMINLIRSENLVNCCVVVTRYFGGILLGTGGLVRAYTSGCRIAIESAGIVQMKKTVTILCEVPYAAWDSVRYRLDRLSVQFREPEYHTAVSFELKIISTEFETVLKELEQASGRTLEYIYVGEDYAPWEKSE